MGLRHMALQTSKTCLLLYRTMIGGQGLPHQYTQGYGLISCIDLIGEPCVVSVMTELAIRIFLFSIPRIPPIKSRTLHGANTRTGRCHVLWLVYSVPSNVWRRASPSPHMAPHLRAFFSHEATNGIDMQ